MIRSMTGFGRCEVCEGSRKYTVEIKSVNHRYLDVNMKMPRKLNFLEADIRSFLKEYAQRGKIDVFILCEDTGAENAGIRYNRGAAAKYLEYLRCMAQEFGLEDDIRVSALSRFPEVFSMDEEETDGEEVWRVLQKALQGAAQMFVNARTAEGARLKEDLLSKLDEMLSHVAFIEERSPQIIVEYRKKLTDRVRELLGETAVEEGRLLTEVTVFADKVCVDEEIVRLKSHTASMRQELLRGGGIGRKLDFLAQEMNREANTILSKTSDLAVSDCGIELKTLIEKVREQIQNIE